MEKTKIEELEIDLKLAHNLHEMANKQIVSAHRAMLINRLELDQYRSMTLLERIMWVFKIRK